MFMSAMLLGMWPFLAPTKNRREEAKIPPFTAPNVEQATKKGIIHLITPNSLFPNVYGENMKNMYF